MVGGAESSTESIRACRSGAVLTLLALALLLLLLRCALGGRQSFRYYGVLPHNLGTIPHAYFISSHIFSLPFPYKFN